MKFLFDFYIKKHKFAIFSLGIEVDNKYLFKYNEEIINTVCVLYDTGDCIKLLSPGTLPGL